MKQTQIKEIVFAWFLPALLLIALTGCVHMDAGETGSVQRMTKEELKARLNDPDTILIDVRSKRDWEKSDQKIPGAVRQNPTGENMAWAAGYPRDKTMVLYCA